MMELGAGLDLTHSFTVVAEELNFRRSAERLHIDQSALTRRIQKLEHILGFALFERTTRDVALTPAGRAFYEDNALLLQNYARSVNGARMIAEGKTGTLRIAYMAFAATELMPRAVSRFRQLYPDIQVTLRYIRTQGQKLALADDDVDLGYMIGPFDHSDFESLLVADDPLYVVTPLGHRFASLQAIQPNDLVGEDLILGDMVEWEAYRWRLGEMFSREGVPLDIKIEASNTLALLGLVAAGSGVTIYPKSLIGFLGHNVEVRPVQHPDFRVQTVLVRKRSNRANAVRNYLELAEIRAL
ncbi:MAG: LysR family transcriptional regulator [Rhizobiaceae bacterium]